MQNKENENHGLAVKAQGTLDVSNPDYICFQSQNMLIEIIGGVHDVVLTTLKVTLKIYKVGTVSPLEIYRSNQVDLFNENQVNYLITKTCERLRIETVRFREILYDCIEQLESFRKEKPTARTTEFQASASIQKQTQKILASDNLLNSIEKLITQAGIVDTRLGLQLYLLGISRITKKPIHVIVQGKQLTLHSIIKNMLPMFPSEHIREVTTISKYALSYPPSTNYWDNKTLVLHQLESIKEKENTLLEYVVHGQSKRLVTQANIKTGRYESYKKEITCSINLISYTAQDYHPVFNGKQTVCIPMQHDKAIQEKMYMTEVRELAGMVNHEQEKKALALLAQIQRELVAKDIYNPIVEEVDISKFFKNDIKALSKYLQIVNLITLLHQHQSAITPLQVQAEYMLQALEWFQVLWLKKDDELYYNVRGTFNRIKKYLQKTHKEDYQETPFKLKEVRKALSKSPVTMQRHLHTLEQYGKVERVGGTNKTGFDYMVTEWDQAGAHVGAYEELIKDLKDVIEKEKTIQKK